MFHLVLQVPVRLLLGATRPAYICSTAVGRHADAQAGSRCGCHPSSTGGVGPLWTPVAAAKTTSKIPT
ncbi:hypothetical protein OEZ85_006219 [Tetradesmus obliquus]|uniref:Secreted protein n=1 Tax=Tetradesmus obliquus TaxID=3088 RepID=A0ABY8TYM2_TETOB|nr:hypothetical protein OEZ85_006219 [Tetradesmus obliquus]